MLGLPEDASPESIRARFRALAMQLHPDQGNDDAEAFVRLQEARVSALGESSDAPLVPLDQVTQLVRVATGALAHREEQRARREESESVKRQVVRARTSPLKAARRRVSFLTGLTALLGGLSQLIRVLPWDSASLVATLVGATLGLYTSLLGLIIWRHTQRIAQIQDAVEDATEALEERPTFVRAVREIAQERESLPLTRDHLLDLVDAWSERNSEYGYSSMSALLAPSRRPAGLSLADCARVIGPEDFAKLVIAKGKELELLIEHEEWVEGELVVTYALSTGSNAQ